MAGVSGIPRRPLDDLRSESNENKKKQRSKGPDKSEMVKLTMELFGDSISKNGATSRVVASTPSRLPVPFNPQP